MTLGLSELGVVVCAVGAFALSTVSGTGGVALLTPILALTLPINEAIALVTAPMLLANLSKVVVLRAHVAWGDAGRLLVVAAPLAFFAAALAPGVSPLLLRAGVASIGVASVVARHLGVGRVRSSATWTLLVFAVPLGLTSGLMGSSGPLGPAILRARDLGKESFVATFAVVGLALQAARLPSYVADGRVGRGHLGLECGLVVAAVLGVLVGRWVLGRVEEEHAARLVDGMVLASSASLVWGAS